MSNKMTLSYSALLKLCRNPEQFHKEYILGEREILENKYLKKGGLFHLFILEPQNFDDKFVVLPTQLPTDSVQQVIRNVWESFKLNNEDDNSSYILTDFYQEILDHLKAINLYQSYKTDKQRLDKVCCPEGMDYFRVLQESDQKKKVIVDTAVIQKASDQATIMLEHDWVQEFLHTDTPEIDVRKEMELIMELKNYKFNLRGVIDCLRIDHKNETIHIIDFKTTSKTIEEWRASFLDSPYMYWLQMMIYKELVYSLVPEDSKRAWKLKVWFPVIDKNNHVYVFPVSDQTLHESQLKVLGVYDIANWHISNKEYGLPYNYAKGLVEL
jgi:hypothetical protein